MTNVLVVEDERLASGMLCQYIQSANDRYTLVDAIKNAADAELYCLKKQIDLILMDICTTGTASGLDAAKKIKAQYPCIKIIIITSTPEYRFLQKAREAGAESFWYKDVSEEELLDIMDRTIAGESLYPDRTPPIPIGDITSADLSPKELETLYWLVRLGSIKQIAEKMNISVDGVNKHLRDIKNKTGIMQTNQLAMVARGTRLIMPEF